MRTLLSLLALAVVSCGDDAPSSIGDDLRDAPVTDVAPADVTDAADAAADTTPAPPPDRAPGERRPPAGPCDDADPTRCLLPWPSDTFATLAPERPTGLRVAIPADAIPPQDDVAALDRADGFSRLSPIVTVFPPLDPASVVTAPIADGAADGPVRLFVAEPGPAFATAAPLDLDAFHELAPEPASTLVALPLRPLAPSSEHLVVVTDALRAADGAPLAPDRHARVALGLTAPADDAERALFAYHAPSRAVLADAGLAPTRVVRLWSFTTRSAEDPRADLRALRALHRAAVDDGSVEVVIASVARPGGDAGDGPIAAIVRGHLTGLPTTLDAEGRVSRDPDGAPVVTGTHAAPFRVVIPAGDGDYRVVMYAHGTGGDVGDGSFDALIAEGGAAKVSLEIDGWTGESLGDTLSSFFVPFRGTDAVASRVLESLAGGAAILHALDGPLGDALAADTLGDAPNPAAGRRPDTAAPIWAGGSLGGVVGLIFSHLEPTVAAGVLNVPGAGFTHWLPRSDLYAVLELAFENSYPTAVDLNLMVAMTQLAFDPMDGGVWADARAPAPPLLVQISMGDPVLPNVGSALVATATDAVHVGAPLAPLVGLDLADEALGRAGVTQYRVPDDGAFDVHGFAARDTPAGRAAREQLIDFATSVWAGAPRIGVPSGCRDNTPPMSCDFSAPPEAVR